MENNTLISHELEEMRSQINILKEQLERQTIVNDRHIRNSIGAKTSDLNRIIRRTVGAGIFAVIYCPLVFMLNDLSTAFIIVTTIGLAISLAATVYQYIALRKIDFSQGNLVTVAEVVGRLRKHYGQWTKIVAPLILIPWLGWAIYEFYNIDGRTGLIFSVAVAVGGLIGGLVGYNVNRKVIRKADEILSQLEDLQKGE